MAPAAVPAWWSLTLPLVGSALTLGVQVVHARYVRKDLEIARYHESQQQIRDESRKDMLSIADVEGKNQVALALGHIAVLNNVRTVLHICILLLTSSARYQQRHPQCHQRLLDGNHIRGTPHYQSQASCGIRQKQDASVGCSVLRSHSRQCEPTEAGE